MLNLQILAEYLSLKHFYKKAQDVNNMDDVQKYGIHILKQDVFAPELDDDYSFGGVRTPAVVVEEIRERMLEKFNETTEKTQIKLIKPEIVVKSLKSNIAKESLQNPEVKKLMNDFQKIVSATPHVITTSPIAGIEMFLTPGNDSSGIDALEKLRVKLGQILNGEVLRIVDKIYSHFIKEMRTSLKRLISSHWFYNGFRQFSEQHNLASRWYYGRGKTDAKDSEAGSALIKIKILDQEFMVNEETYKKFIQAGTLKDGLEFLPDNIQEFVKDRLNYDPAREINKDERWQESVDLKNKEEEEARKKTKKNIKELLKGRK